MTTTVISCCYNEYKLIPYFVDHYRTNIPSCRIVIYDNYSTDGSVVLAQSLGCDVVLFDTQDIMDELFLTQTRNNVWKNYKSDWIVVCDIDEWLCVTQADLLREYSVGSTIIGGVGFNIVCDCDQNLSNFSMENTNFGFRDTHYDKALCFQPSQIQEINYSYGSHSCSPIGNIRFGNSYILKHMNYLGLDYYINKSSGRFDRNDKMRSLGLNIHYSKDKTKLTSEFYQALNKAKRIYD